MSWVELGFTNYDRWHLSDRVIEACRQFASSKNVHLTLVVHPRKEEETSQLTISSVFGSAKATQVS